MGLRGEAPPLYRVLHAALRPVLNAVWNPEVEGLQHVPATGPAILASNHLSFSDHFFLAMALNRAVYFLGKSDYFVGWKRFFFENAGVMPVFLEGGDAGEASLRKGQEILAAGRLLGIYPEGTRSPDGRLYRGKTGPVRLALRTGVPIIPAAMIGPFEVMPPGKAMPSRGPVAVRFGRPLDFARYAGRENDHEVLRTATDELMYELMLLSGQEYVDLYASTVKAAAAQGALARAGAEAGAEALPGAAARPAPEQERKAS